MKTRISTLIITIFMTSSSHIAMGQAKTYKKTTKNSVTLTNPKIVATSTTSPITSSRSGGVSNEYLISAANNPISATPALSSFKLWYNNGDHKVRTIGILHQQGAMNAKYSDQNGDDPFRVQADWINVPGATGGSISAAGGGTFNIQLPEKPTNTTLVLSGFCFERLAGTDHNIRTISIQFDQEKSLAQVSLLDDQREDFRSVVDPISTGLLAIAPFGTIIETGITIDGILKSMNNESKNSPRPYVATIQYAYIPNSYIVSNGLVSGTSRSKDAMQGQVPNWSVLAYRGFMFRFNNSDHHLLGIGVHLNGINIFPGQRGSKDAPITFQDNNQDDPIQWMVEYSKIK